ncbi:MULTISPECIES: peptide deformylase [unclassified Streptomyces]|uniref:peptide deformylase n=1 Tax=unclassified Streptomyces TaxID=2593676 RepID=UPI000DD8CA83|nr:MULTISPECIES: peptide deformylase [unclassified Streptomyces]QZZ26412.1 peptide deformylase [Streptomyces sp. ST1015]
MPHRSIPGTRGRVRPITLHGAPSLHTPCAEVPAFTPELAALVEDMFATMYAAQGVGLAANQLGEPLRVFVYDCPDDEEVRHVGHIVNPRLTGNDGVVIRGPEGCLSLPGLEAGTERYDETVIEGYTVTGDQITVKGTGFFARCLQHEMDHLEGKTYADRLAGRRHRKLMKQVNKAPWS